MTVELSQGGTAEDDDNDDDDDDDDAVDCTDCATAAGRGCSALRQ